MIIQFLSIQIYVTRGGGFSKPQHFDSPPVSPVPRTTSSPRNALSSISSIGEYTPNQSGNADDRKQRSIKKKYPVVNGNITPNSTITSSIDQQQVSYSFFFLCLIPNKKIVDIYIYRRRKRRCRRKRIGCIFHLLREFFSLLLLLLFFLSYLCYPSITSYVFCTWKKNLSST